jgi:hypothetical protein
MGDHRSGSEFDLFASALRILSRMKTSKISSHLPCLVLVLGGFGLGFWLNEWKNQRVMETEVKRLVFEDICNGVEKGLILVREDWREW